MNEGLAVQENGLPVLSDDTLIHIAEQAEKRIDAVIKIKQVALKVTNANDWVDQEGKPYLMASGSEKIANLFNISWRIDEPTLEQEADGAVTYNYRGEFSLAGRTIQVEGSRSSRDTFFKKYIYENGQKVGEKPLDRRDLKMAALTNLLGNGITRILGIRNLTYDDLEKFAGIKQPEVKGVKYKKDGQDKASPSQPQSKSGQESGKDLRAEITKMVNDMVEEDLRNDYLMEKTAWDGKDRNTGETKHFEGKTDLTQVSDAAIKVVYGKVKKDYEAWQKQQGPTDA